MNDGVGRIVVWMTVLGAVLLCLGLVLLLAGHGGFRGSGIITGGAGFVVICLAQAARAFSRH
jgi:predicted cobalt transporter CbtA